MRAGDEGDLLFELEHDLTLALQALRRDLYFLRAAALATSAGAVLVAGASGAGKSTLAWGLAHHGFRCLSDELAPVDLRRLEVHAYPPALRLKTRPPRPYLLPTTAVETSQGFHIPVSQLGGASRAPIAIRAIFLLGPRAAERRSPGIRPLSAGEAATRLLPHALNPLAHPGDGLDAV